MLRFTIRDVLWLTVVVAFAVLWSMEMRQRTREGAELRETNRQLVQQRNRARSSYEAMRVLLQKGIIY